MIFKRSFLPLCLLFIFYSTFTFSQESTNKEDNITLDIIQAAADALEAEDYLKCADFLNLAKDRIDLSSSPRVLYSYYQNVAELSFIKYEIAEAQDAYLKSIESALKLGDTVAIVASHSGMANALLIDNKYKKALKYQEAALEMLKNKKSPTYYGVLANTALAYRQTKDFDAALSAFMEVKNYFQKSGDFKSQAVVENNLGELYRENFNDFAQADAHYKRAIALNIRANEKNQLSKNFHNLALLFQENNKIDSAFFYIHKAISLKGEIGDSGGRALSNHALGTIQLTAGQYDEAINSFEESLEISTLFGITPGLFYANMGIGNAHFAKGEHKEALEYYLKVEKITSDLESFDMKKAISKTLLDFYKENRDFEKALLYSDKLQAIEDSIASFQSDERMDELRIQYETNLAEKENAILKEIEVVQKDRIALQNIFLIILLIALGVFTGLVIILLKANRQKKIAYKEVTKATKELEKQYLVTKDRETELYKTVSLKDKIFSVLGHDLRTPLANISSLIDSMSQIELSPEEMDFMLRHLKGETNASLKTLENILQWARLQMNDKSILVTEIDEDGIIIEIIQNFESNSEAKEIKIKYLNKSNSILWADENQFRSIANNLIANAIKYSPLRGDIVVSFIEERDSFVFSVCDQGNGINASVIENLETQQELMSSYGTEGEKGTGIGLRIVKDFVHLHNGKLEFTSNEPSGTIVTVHLPKLIKHEMVSDTD